MRAHAVSRLTRLYPFASGCGSLANHRFVDKLAGSPKHDAWAKVEGGLLSVSLADHVGRAAFYVGDLDRKVSMLIDRFVKPGDTVLDIGANIGLVSLRLSKRVGPTGTVHAFEPNPAIADRLEASLARNHIRNVRLHRTALGDTPGNMMLFVPEGNAGAASLVSGRVHGETCDVPVQRLDDMDLESVSFIKMDVEGFEEQVLRGAGKMLSERPPRAILFEQNDKRGASIPLLCEAGYTIHGIARSLFTPQLHRLTAWSAEYNDYIALLPVGRASG